MLAELRLRGLADRTLVIAPAGLVTQWQEELERKFAAADRHRGRRCKRRPVTSLAARHRCLARRGAPRSAEAAALRRAQWDLLIVDEAHRLPNAAQRLGEAGARAERPLPAAAHRDAGGEPPVRTCTSCQPGTPGLLGTAAQFRAAPRRRRRGPAVRQAVGSRPQERRRAAKRTAEVMIRHRRSEVSVLLPQRLAETRLIQPAPAERDWYADLGDRIRKEGREAPRPGGCRCGHRTAGRLKPAGRRARAAQGWAGTTWPTGRRALDDRPKAHALLDLLRGRDRPGGEGPGVHRLPAHPRRAGQPRRRSAASRRPSTTAACHGRRRTGDRPRSATRWTGAAVHGVGRRGAEPPVLPRHGQHGPAVEPDGDRAAPRPAAPGRARSTTWC